jgi:hypothetical protein
MNHRKWDEVSLEWWSSRPGQGWPGREGFAPDGRLRCSIVNLPPQGKVNL